MDGNISPAEAVPTYARRLGLFSGTMAVIGGIIGGGIFRTPSTVAERANLRNAAVGGPLLGLRIPVYAYWSRRSQRPAG